MRCDSDYKIRSRLNVNEWERELADDPDREFLLQGVRAGFHIVDPKCNIMPCDVKNHKSATDSTSSPYVEELILHELQQGH